MEKLPPNDNSGSHTNIVVQVKPCYIETIGGNVSNTIKQRHFETTDKGLIQHRNKRAATSGSLCWG